MEKHKRPSRLKQQTTITPRDASLLSNGKYTEREIFLMCKNGTDKFKFVQPIKSEMYFIITESFLDFISK